VGLFHGIQSFKNRLLQCRSPVGSQVLPANLLQYGLLSPWLHRSCQEPAPAWALHGVTASFGHPRTAEWISAAPWISMDCRGTTYFTMIIFTGCSGVSALTPGAPPPPQSFFTNLGVCRGVSLTDSHSSLLDAVTVESFFLPLLKYVSSQRCYLCC